MAVIGFHASHEQFAPSDLLALASQAEATGVPGHQSSDHFKPWAEALRLVAPGFPAELVAELV